MYANVSEYLGLYENKNTVPKSIMNTVPSIPVRKIPEYQVQQKPVITSPITSPIKPGSTSDPKVWGPPFWYSLHVSAAHYPENPSPIVRERMKQRILAIPYEVPCSTCRPHASAFIEKNRENLDKIVSSKHDLFSFYVDFHNKVNERYGKKKYTYDEAYNLYK